MQSSGDDERPPPFLNVPVVVLVLLAALVLAHVARLGLSPEAGASLFAGYGLDPAAYSRAALKAMGLGPDWWRAAIRPFSALFLHPDWTALGINGLWLLVAGPIVARRFGGVDFLIFFLLCGLAGAVVFVACNWDQTGVVIGAAGAVAGLLGAALRMVRLEAITAGDPLPPSLKPIFSLQILLFSGVLLMTYALAGVAGLGTTGGTIVSWPDAAGGYLAGLLLAGPFDRVFGAGERGS